MAVGSGLGEAPARGRKGPVRCARVAGLGVSELRELRQIREENRKLKGLVADLTLDKQILQESLRRKW